jgi:hypothetical protein
MKQKQMTNRQPARSPALMLTSASRGNGTLNEAELRSHQQLIAEGGRRDVPAMEHLREVDAPAWDSGSRPAPPHFGATCPGGRAPGASEDGLEAVAAVLKDPSRPGPDTQAARQQRVRQIILDAPRPPPHDVVLSSGEGWPLAPAAVTTGWHVSNSFVTVWRRDPTNSPLHIQTPVAHGLMQPSIWG